MASCHGGVTLGEPLVGGRRLDSRVCSDGLSTDGTRRGVVDREVMGSGLKV